MSPINSVAPQFLVEKLEASVAYYERQLGFSSDFVYDGFYGSVSREGAAIHLKCAPKLEAERVHQREGEHVDAFFDVSGVDELHNELSERGATILQEPMTQAWGRRDFRALDLDGYILCFSEEVQDAQPE